MKVNRFEELNVWQKAINLVEEIYRLTSDGLLETDFSLKDQIRRAAVSIPANIAEGFERRSAKEFQQFLNIAKGSCGELRCLISLSNRIGYVDNNKSTLLNKMCIEISKMLSGLSKSLE